MLRPVEDHDVAGLDTRERPLSSSSNLLSMLLVSTPIKVLMMKMPPSVTANMAKRKFQPVSPPHGAGVERAHEARHVASPSDMGASPAGPMRASHTMRATTSTTTAESSASQPMMAAVPPVKGIVKLVAQPVAPGNLLHGSAHKRSNLVWSFLGDGRYRGTVGRIAHHEQQKRRSCSGRPSILPKPIGLGVCVSVASPA